MDVKICWNDGAPFDDFMGREGAPPVATRHLCFGGGKGGGGTSTQYSGVQIPQEVLQRYNKATDRAETASQQPWQNYGGEFVAPVNATQQGGYDTMMGGQNYTQAGYNAGMGGIQQGLGAAAPLMNQASGSINTGQVQGQALGAAGLGQAAEAYQGAQPFNQQAGQNFNQAFGGAQGYNAAATGAAISGMGAVDPSQLNLNQFLNPYQQQVTAATMAQLNQQQAQQRNDQRGNMIREGSWGGDRGGIANANMVNQQNMATGSVLSGLNQQNYNQALAAAQQQQGVGLGAAQANRQAIQQGAGQMLGIGQQGYQQGMGLGQAQQGLGQQQYTQGMGQAQYTGQMGQQLYGQGVGAGQAQQGLGAANYGMYSGAGALGSQLAGQAFGQNMQTAQGQIGFGSLQQQTQQAQDSALYNQWMQERGYPFQTSQFYTNAVMGTGPLSGSSAYSGAFTPQPFFSDDRVKENMEPIGTTHDGQVIYRFNYKGQPGTQIGLSAQEVEKRHPEAVSEHGGVKAVDYSAATDEAARPHKADGGAVVDEHYKDGYTAQKSGVSIGKNPHRQSDPKWASWRSGWANAKGGRLDINGNLVERPAKQAGGPLGGDPFGYQPPQPGLPPGVGILGQPASLPTAGPTAVTGGSIGDIVATQRAMLAANAPGGGPPSRAGIDTPQAQQTPAPEPAAGPAASPVMGAVMGGGLGAATPFTSPDGSANGATGAAGAGSVGASVGEGTSVSGGEAGTVGAGVGGNAGTAAGTSDPGVGDAGPGTDSGTWASGGRVGYAAGGTPAYGGGFGSLDQILAAQQAMYGSAPWAGKSAAGVGNAGIVNAQPIQASKLITPPEAKKPAATESSAKQATGAVDDLSKTAKSVEGLYGMGKEAIVGSPQKGTPAVGKPGDKDYKPASSDYKPATGGIIGYGGKWSGERPEEKPGNGGSDGADTGGSSGYHDDTPAAPPGRQPWDERVDTPEGSLGDLNIGSSYPDIDTEIADWSNYRRGGRAGLGRARFKEAGAVEDKDMPFAGESMLPSGSYDPADPENIPKPPDPSKGQKEEKKDSTLGDIGQVVGMAAKIAPFFLARGGQAYADGGEVNDNEPLEPGLGSASSAMEDSDNVHWGVFSRSQGHKMVGRAVSKNRARTIRDKRDNDYGGYDHFLKPIPPARKRYAGGRLAFADGGDPDAVAAALEEEQATRARLLEQQREAALIEARGAPGLGAAEAKPTAAESLTSVSNALAAPNPESPAERDRPPITGLGGLSKFDRPEPPLPGGTPPPYAQPFTGLRNEPDTTRAPVTPPPPPPAADDTVTPRGGSPGEPSMQPGFAPAATAAQPPTPQQQQAAEIQRRGAPGLGAADQTTASGAPIDPNAPAPPAVTGPAKPPLGGATTTPPATPPVTTPAAPPPGGGKVDVHANILTRESGNQHWDANGNPKQGKSGESGVGQFMPDTAKLAAQQAGVAWNPELFYRKKTGDPVKDKEAEDYNRLLSSAHFNALKTNFGGDEAKAAAAYNCGQHCVETAVKNHGADWMRYIPNSTQAYVMAVTGQGGGGMTVTDGRGGGDKTGLGASKTGEPVPVAADASGLGGATPEAMGLWGKAKDWWDRNDTWITPLLSGIGGMLSSPSRTLAGSIGSGLVAGAGQYGTLGQRQQKLDIDRAGQAITQRTQLLEHYKNLQQRRAGLIAAGGQNAPGVAELNAQLAYVEKLIGLGAMPGRVGGGGGGGGTTTTGGGTTTAPGGGATTAPGGGTTTAPTQPKPDQGTMPPSMRRPDPTFPPDYEAKLHPNSRPTELRQRALAVAADNPEESKRLNGLADKAQAEMATLGGLALDGVSRVPPPENVRAYQQSEARVPENEKWRAQQGDIRNKRDTMRSSINNLVDTVQNFEPSALASFKNDLARYATGALKLADITLPPGSTINLAEYQSFVKNVANVLAAAGDPTVSSGDARTDQARATLASGFATPDLQPSTVRKILADSLALLDHADKYSEDVQAKMKDAPWIDRSLRTTEFNGEPGNSLDEAKKKHRSELAVAGDVPSRRDDFEAGHHYILGVEDVYKLFGGEKDKIREQFGNRKRARFVAARGEDGSIIIKEAKK